MPLHVRRATPADLDSIARISTITLGGGEYGAATFPPHLASTEQDAYTTEFTWRKWRMANYIHDPSVAIFVAVDDDSSSGEEKVVGWSLWELPSSGWKLDEKAKETFKTHGKALVGAEAFERTRKCVDPETAKKAERIVDDAAKGVFGRHDKHDVYYLSFLCIDPPYQRRGIGKLLLQWGLERAASERKDCYLLSTPEGVRLYMAGGFEDCGTTDFFGIPHKVMLIKNNPSWKDDTTQSSPL